MLSTHKLSQKQLITIALFYAEAGVNWVFEPEKLKKSIKLHEAYMPTKNVSLPKYIESKTTTLPFLDSGIIEKAQSVAKKSLTLIQLKSGISSFNSLVLKNNTLSTICAHQTGEESGLMVIGYTPSREDEKRGKAFSGKAGHMLDQMLKSIGLVRQKICVSMIIPWCPTGNRKLENIEIEACRPFIERQIELVSPRFILLLGNSSSQFFFGKDCLLHANRNKWSEIYIAGKKIPTLSTLHPQELFISPLSKKLAWHDLIILKTAFDNT
ncbi:Uracil-DNA glycosylase, family 4 [Liberibacter crescens BT-1]|uniref:Uracil-DNA glycosylase, family 4 n=1 Tax=Liberibacter crescens (strain BT-1) TaxID=1215343 RepID=L0EWQ1_LIBCB|nr:uracil-DNA glycosylase [Liberibacter crescens]AGA65290.1 Uracil-DNA glycosylase, family 4 [Liberibacter crescens BT-1]AMC13223.1 hypothetical protein RL73_06565 [Liberibacter crescens]